MTQWAAVIAYSSLISEAPQMCPPEYLRDNCHGQDTWTAVVPPTIRDCPGLLPQDATGVRKADEDMHERVSIKFGGGGGDCPLMYKA